MRSNKKKTSFIIGLVFAMILMAAGYSALSTTLTIESRNRITANWDIHIDSNATTVTTTGDGSSRGFTVSSDGLSASFTVDLYEEGDSVEYDVTVVNAGNIPARLDSVMTNISNESDFIQMTTTANRNTIVNPNGSYSFKVKVEVVNPNQLQLEESIGTKYTLSLRFVQYVQS